MPQRVYLLNSKSRFMFGHGSPHWNVRLYEPALTPNRAWSWRGVLSFLVGLSLSLVMAPDRSAAGQKTTEEIAAPVKIRCQWGGGDKRTFVGSLKVLGGRLEACTPLSVDTDAAVTTRQNGNGMSIHHLLPTDFGGADLLIVPEASSETKLVIDLSSVEFPEIKSNVAVSLKQLDRDPAVEILDESANRISVSRPDSDQIQVNIGRPHVVFESGESWGFRWRPNRVKFESNTAKGTLEIRRSGTARRLIRKTVAFERTADGTWDWQQSDFEVPSDEGVYQMTLTIHPPWYRPEKKIGVDKIRRMVEFVVIKNAPPDRQDSGWDVIDEINLATDFDHDLPKTGTQSVEDKKRLLPPIPMLAFGPSLESLSKRLEKKQALGNKRRSIVQHDEKPLLQLEVSGWQTIPLQFSQLDVPYAIEVDYLTSGPLSLGLSLLEHDREQQVTVDGFDSGVFLPESVVRNSNQGRIETHRFNVWPVSKKTHLLLVNRHRNHPVAIQSIRVLKSGGRLPMLDNENPSSKAATSDFERRQLFAMIENVDFKAEYNLPGEPDPRTGQPLDDWDSFYQATDRLIQQLKAGGFSGAHLAVMADGTSLFPSSLIKPSPWCDTGIFFSDGRDPVRKDVLEMMLRMFQREGLKLVPMLAFNSPLPDVEDARLATSERSRFEVTSFGGTRHVFGSDQKLPIYNPLDPTVQHSVVRVVKELGARYRGSDAFAGIALACRPDTFTLLPGSRWGYDEMTIRNFVRQNPDLGLAELPTPAILSGRLEQDWLRWRCEKMADWYESLADCFVGHSKSRKLYVAPVDLYRNEELATQLAPNLHRTIDFAKLLLKMGLVDPRFLDRADKKYLSASVVRLIPHRLAFDRSTTQHRANAAVKNAKQIDAVFSGSGFSGDLFHHRGQWAHFSQLQQEKPFSEQKKPLLRMQRLGPGQHFSRQRFVEAIKKQDTLMLVDGGWRSFAGDANGHEMLRVFKQLPEVRFENVRHELGTEADSLPIAVRQLNSTEGSVFYIANASPWPVKVRMQMLPTTERDQVVVDSLSKTIFERSTDHPNSFEVTLPPFSLVGGKSATHNLIDSFAFEWVGDVANDLRKRVFALQLKLHQSQQVEPVVDFANVESTAKNGTEFDAWEIGNQNSAKFKVLLVQPVKNGESQTSSNVPESCLRIASDSNALTWIRSHPIKVTSTGRLSISVWLRKPPSDSKMRSSSSPPVVRVAVDGRSTNGDYYRFGEVGGEQQQLVKGRAAEFGQWNRYAVHFDDLPDQLSDLRIGFDVVGDGAVDIARVRLYDRWFDDKDARAITQLLASADAMLLQPAKLDRCRRLLEEYWAEFLNEHFSLRRQPRNAKQKIPMFRQKSRQLGR